MNSQKLTVEYISIDELKPYDRNAKLHPKKQIEQIARSIKEYGMNDPIGVWKDNVIIEGHGRLEACKKLGIDTVPIVRLDHLTDEQRREYTLVHNKTTMNSDFDTEMLDFEIKGLQEFDADFYDFELASEGDKVLDSFGGSGTTLIACEQLGRMAFLCELDPHYCDVIIQRWENLTGQKAVLCEDNENEKSS